MIPDRNLILVHHPGYQAAEDWEEIAAYVREIDPQIAVFTANNRHSEVALRKQAQHLPTLVFSPVRLRRFRPRRGKVYQGRRIPKLEQLRRMALAGIAAPKAALLTPDLVLDPAEWGEYVVVKPPAGSGPRSPKLMRTSRVRYVPPSEFPEGHPGRKGPMIVQRWIDTGGLLTHYRVLTLFGEPLYAICERRRAPSDDSSRMPGETDEISVASQDIDFDHGEFIFTEEADVLATARAMFRSMPEVALQACDLIREAGTGQLYALEINPGGNTWHFSSHHLAEWRARLGADFERRRRTQFNAFFTAARVLAERTRAEAE